MCAQNPNSIQVGPRRGALRRRRAGGCRSPRLGLCGTSARAGMELMRAAAARGWSRTEVTGGAGASRWLATREGGGAGAARALGAASRCRAALRTSLRAPALQTTTLT